MTIRKENGANVITSDILGRICAKLEAEGEIPPGYETLEEARSEKAREAEREFWEKKNAVSGRSVAAD